MGSEQAFRELVERYVNLVYSAAIRHLEEASAHARRGADGLYRVGSEGQDPAAGCDPGWLAVSAHLLRGLAGCPDRTPSSGS